VPNTIEELLDRTRRERESLVRRHRSSRDGIRAIVDRAHQEGRQALTEYEDKQVTKLVAEGRQLRDELDTLDQKLEELRSVALEEAEVQRQAGETKPTPAATRKPAYDQVARVAREERTYHPGVDRTGKGFLLDVSRQFLFGDVRARAPQPAHGRGAGRARRRLRAAGGRDWRLCRPDGPAVPDRPVRAGDGDAAAHRRRRHPP
jgi:hypothetical protein